VLSGGAKKGFRVDLFLKVKSVGVFFSPRNRDGQKLADIGSLQQVAA
jgi:hypothetical protein